MVSFCCSTAVCPACFACALDCWTRAAALFATATPKSSSAVTRGIYPDDGESATAPPCDYHRLNVRVIRARALDARRTSKFHTPPLMSPKNCMVAKLGALYEIQHASNATLYSMEGLRGFAVLLVSWFIASRFPRATWDYAEVGR